MKDGGSHCWKNPYSTGSPQHPGNEGRLLHTPGFFFSRGAPVRFSGIQMIHALGGFHRQSNPQHRDQAQWPQSQEAQLCSQMNTRPLRENTNTIQPIRFNEDRLESRLKLGRI